MRRLEGKGDTERILFGRELFGKEFFMLPRRRLFVAAVYALIFCACISCVIFVSLRRDKEGTQGSVEAGVPPAAENMAEENKSDGGEDSTEENDDGGTVGERDTTVTEESVTNEPNTIIYKDFSTSYLNIKNNTAFDISFVNSQSYTLPKYYTKGDVRPTVLVLHTYTSDRYYDSEGKYGVCTVGEALCEELNSMGIGAVYSSAVHDGDLDDPADNARETIEFYLKMYPTIKYVFDVGVAQEYDGDRIVATSGACMGDVAAQIKFAVAGNNMASGRDNLYLAAEISKNLSRGGMTIAREIVYDDSIKNSSHTPYYLEIFIGSSGNCEAEALRSTRILASAFAEFLL